MQDWFYFFMFMFILKFLKVLVSGLVVVWVRVIFVFEVLGEGLLDVVFRCCCYMDGMEVIEKYFGWFVWFGKVVLWIVLI